MGRTTLLDAYQAIDEVVMQYRHGGVSAERAMSNIAAIIADHESGTEDEVPEPDEDDRGPHARFQMYTREGNDACAKLVLDLAERCRTDFRTRAEAITWLKNGVRILALTHGEVHDTEPEWAIVDAVNALFEVIGYREVTRDEVFW